MKQYYVYIMNSASGTLYTGMTNDLMRRVIEQKIQFLQRNTTSPAWHISKRRMMCMLRLLVKKNLRVGGEAKNLN